MRATSRSRSAGRRTIARESSCLERPAAVSSASPGSISSTGPAARRWSSGSKAGWAAPDLEVSARKGDERDRADDEKVRERPHADPDSGRVRAAERPELE